jgi:TatD DNase family protein
MYLKIEQQFIERMQHPKTVAWGEMGLDFHYNHSPPDVQIRLVNPLQNSIIENEPSTQDLITNVCHVG